MEEAHDCALVDIGALWIENPVPDGIPALRIEELVEVLGEEPWVSTSYFGPGVARIQDADMDILLDLTAGFVAFADFDDPNWSVESLEDWQAHIENLRDEAKSHLISSKPKYALSDKDLLSDIECLRYHLVAKLQRPDAAGEHIEKDLWITKDIKTTREIYSTYRRAKLLFDRNFIEVPAELPRGFIMRSRSVRQPLDRNSADAARVEDVTVFDVGHEFVAPEFFDIEAHNVLSPVTLDDRQPAVEPHARGMAENQR